MKLGKNEELIYSEYLEKQDRYVQLEAIVSEKLDAIIKEHNFFVMSINTRVKTAESFKNKLKKKQGKYNSLLDITDLCASRIICYFGDTVDEIAEVLSQEFDMDKANSIDKRRSISETQFGYLSLHYILSLKKGQGADELSDIKFEVQIRTVLQHAWAEIEHDLGYKSEFALPRPLRREFSRIAGLLEIADNQFVGLRKSLISYTKETKEKIARGECQELLIDQISINLYVESNREFQELMEKISARLGVDYISSDVDSSIAELNWLEIKTLGQFIGELNKHQDAIVEMETRKQDKYDLDFITPILVVRDMCKAKLLEDNYSMEQIKRYMLLGTESEERALKRTNRLINDHI